jgi:hypothetical protein
MEPPGRCPPRRALIERCECRAKEGVLAAPPEVAVLRSEAEVARRQGRHEEAVRLYGEAVALCREAGDPALLAHTVREGRVEGSAGAE